jgi:hypothetical protein
VLEKYSGFLFSDVILRSRISLDLFFGGASHVYHLVESYKRGISISAPIAYITFIILEIDLVPELTRNTNDSEVF